LAQGQDGYIEEVRALDTNDAGLLNPAGLAYSFEANLLYIITASSGSPAVITMMTPLEEALGSVTVATSRVDPINIAFDNRANRLLLLDSAAAELIAIESGPDGHLDTAPAATTRFEVGRLGLQHPTGMTVDPGNGVLFILDSRTSEIVRVEPDAQGDLAGATAVKEGRVSRIDLQVSELVQGRGLALNPDNEHLYMLDEGQKKIVELSQTGQLIATLDMAPFDLGDPQGLVFGLSGDLTDDPTKVNLYLADTGLKPGPGGEFQACRPPPMQRSAEKNVGSGPVVPLGRVLEYSLTAILAN
jgi:DNA-binding beta-propeller fold protein YncE